LNYIHHNPVSGKWNLVNDYTDYEHSSVSFYDLNIVRITSHLTFGAIDGPIHKASVASRSTKPNAQQTPRRHKAFFKYQFFAKPKFVVQYA
jgi:hypothetical protein